MALRKREKEPTNRGRKAICKTSKEHVYLIYKVLLQINKKKTKNDGKISKRCVRHLTKDEISVVNEHMGRCSPSLVTREIKK